jgi:hypothetical protein
MGMIKLLSLVVFLSCQEARFYGDTQKIPQMGSRPDAPIFNPPLDESQREEDLKICQQDLEKVIRLYKRYRYKYKIISRLHRLHMKKYHCDHDGEYGYGYKPNFCEHAK